MKVAILHEMLVKLGGAEKVIESLLKIFPKAELFTLIYDEKKVYKIFDRKKINSQVFSLKTQKVYNLTKNQRLCLPFMSKSVEQLDFSDYDLVIASSSGFAHGAITKPETRFIVYYHSPARYMWDWTNEYKKDIWWDKWLKWFFLNKLFLNLRQWDYIASKRNDISLANSKNTKNRIKKYYKKDSTILYPPVETDRFSKKLKNNSIKYSDYYIIISALTEFKKIEVAIKAFNKIKDKKLIVIWEWNHRQNLEKMTKNKNIIFVGAKYWDDLVSLVQKSSWLIFPWEEDFGIVPIEVMAAWKPIFALKKWWLCESVIEWKTWEFFEDDNWKDFTWKFLEFDEKNTKWKYKSENCKKQAEKFSEKEFEKQLKNLVQNW